MGYWGDGLLENDLALDVHDRFMDLMWSGLATDDAKAAVLAEYAVLPPDSPEDRIVREVLAQL